MRAGAVDRSSVHAPSLPGPSGTFARHIAHTRKQRRDLHTARASRAENRGDLRLYLDSASIFQWEKFAEREIFFGITSNPIILKEDKVPGCSITVYKKLAEKAFSLGYQELHLQTWGKDAAQIYSVGRDIAAIDSRCVVKIPATEEGVKAAAKLKREKARVTLTAVYASHQALTAVSIGADFVAPYLGLMNDANRQGFKDILDMNDIIRGADSSTKVLAAAIRHPSDITQLASQGVTNFTLPVVVADELFADVLTEDVAANFENAARSLGAY